MAESAIKIIFKSICRHGERNCFGITFVFNYNSRINCMKFCRGARNWTQLLTCNSVVFQHSTCLTVLVRVFYKQADFAVLGGIFCKKISYITNLGIELCNSWRTVVSYLYRTFNASGKSLCVFWDWVSFVFRKIYSGIPAVGIQHNKKTDSRQQNIFEFKIFVEVPSLFYLKHWIRKEKKKCCCSKKPEKVTTVQNPLTCRVKMPGKA